MDPFATYDYSELELALVENSSLEEDKRIQRLYENIQFLKSEAVNFKEINKLLKGACGNKKST